MRKKNIAQQLINISDNVTERDRLEAALELGCSYETIRRYLRGEAKKEIFAKKLLGYLEKKVA